MSSLLLQLLLFAAPVGSPAESSTPGRSEAEESMGYAISFGGQYRIMANASNFDFHPRVVEDDPASQSFVNQRFVTWPILFPKMAI